MELHTAPPGEAWRLGHGPFVFAGRPPLLTGELEILSAAEERIRVRGVPTKAQDGPEPLRAYGMDVVRTAARLHPGEHARVAARFVIDPATPPGTYGTELICGEQREEAIVHVFPNEDVSIGPSRLSIAATAGEVVSRVVVVANRGNVAQRIPSLAVIFLEERHWVNRSLVSALRETSEDEGYQRYLDRAFKAIRGSMLSPIRIKILAEGEDLHPGATKEISVELQLPIAMRRGRVYLGSTPLLSGTLGLEVRCTGSAPAGGTETR